MVKWMMKIRKQQQKQEEEKGGVDDRDDNDDDDDDDDRITCRSQSGTVHTPSPWRGNSYSINNSRRTRRREAKSAIAWLYCSHRSIMFQEVKQNLHDVIFYTMKSIIVQQQLMTRMMTRTMTTNTIS